MTLAELTGAKVYTQSGARLGAVHEVYAKGGKVEALGVGAANLLERLLGRRHGHRIPWSKVRKIEQRRIVVEA
jgi:sporulation protein YlmC with PRC-barrel domain